MRNFRREYSDWKVSLYFWSNSYTPRLILDPFQPAVKRLVRHFCPKSYWFGIFVPNLIGSGINADFTPHLILDPFRPAVKTVDSAFLSQILLVRVLMLRLLELVSTSLIFISLWHLKRWEFINSTETSIHLHPQILDIWSPPPSTTLD